MAAKSKAMDAFRANVKTMLEKRGMTITELAERTAMSRPGLSRVLSGEDGVTIPRAERIAAALKVSLPSLIGPEKNLANVA